MADGTDRSHVFIRSLPTLCAHGTWGCPTVRWQVLFLVSLIAGIMLTAGCTEEVPPPAPLSSPDPLLPGQSLIVSGDITGDGIAGGTIDSITIPVSLAPGKTSVDMEKVSVYYADTIRTETLLPVSGFRGDPGQGGWGILEVKNEVGNPNNRLEDKEQFVIRINPKAYLPAKRAVTIVIRAPGDINPLTIRRVAPSTILAQGNILTPP